MAKASVGVKKHERVHKRTSQGGKRPKMASMNKSKKLGFKKYQGQGK